MRNIVCTHCNTNVPVPDDLAQGHCVRCGRALALETNITADPPAASRAIQPEAYVERAPGDVRPLELPERYASWEEFRSLSPAVQKVWMELAMRPLPDLRKAHPTPLPADLRASADDFGNPIASLEVLGENRVFMFILCLILVLSTSILPIVVVFGPYNFNKARDHALPFVFVGATTLAGLGAAYWLMFKRRAQWSVTYWLFENGIVWDRVGRVNACHWEDVQSMAISHEAGGSHLRLQLASDFKVNIFAKNKPEWMPLIEFIATKVNGAQFLPRLRRIFDGELLQFGIVQLDRHVFASSGFHMPWPEITKVVADSLQVFVDCKDRTTWHGIRFSEISFPHLVLVISHIMVEEHKRLPPASPETSYN